MTDIKNLLNKLPIDEINLVDNGDGRYSVEIVSDNGNNDMYSEIDMIVLNATKDNTTEIDNIIEILQIYKLKIIKSN